MELPGITVIVLGALLAFSPSKAAILPPRIDTSGQNMQPAYPQTALKTGEQGSVTLGVAVGVEERPNASASGRPADLMTSMPPPSLR